MFIKKTQLFALNVEANMITNLTPTEIESLSIAIAEECGWKVYQDCGDWILRHESKCVARTCESKEACWKYYLGIFAPPYTTSLDAIQAAAMERFKEYKDRCLFDWHMANLSSINISYWQLTALDWCIAFARTAKIWRYKI